MWKWIDLPPLWLVLFLVLAWLQVQLLPGLVLREPLIELLGGLLVGAGILLIALAAFEMRRHKTTIIPHMTASALVTTGIFSRSRNPIYLADLLIFAGVCLRWGAWPSLVLIPVLMWVLTDRFILTEEERLSQSFGKEFERWRLTTRRWL